MIFWRLQKRSTLRQKFWFCFVITVNAHKSVPGNFLKFSGQSQFPNLKISERWLYMFCSILRSMKLFWPEIEEFLAFLANTTKMMSTIVFHILASFHSFLWISEETLNLFEISFHVNFCSSNYQSLSCSLLRKFYTEHVETF